MSISKVRSANYKMARLLGDYQAIRSGRIMERLANRMMGRLARKAIPWK